MVDSINRKISEEGEPFKTADEAMASRRPVGENDDAVEMARAMINEKNNTTEEELGQSGNE